MYIWNLGHFGPRTFRPTDVSVSYVFVKYWPKHPTLGKKITGRNVRRPKRLLTVNLWPSDKYGLTLYVGIILLVRVSRTR